MAREACRTHPCCNLLHLLVFRGYNHSASEEEEVLDRVRHTCHILAADNQTAVADHETGVA